MKHGTVLERIAASGALDADLERELTGAIEAYKQVKK
jgi:hypothetical protein